MQKEKKIGTVQKDMNENRKGKNRRNMQGKRKTPCLMLKTDGTSQPPVLLGAFFFEIFCMIFSSFGMSSSEFWFVKTIVGC